MDSDRSNPSSGESAALYEPCRHGCICSRYGGYGHDPHGAGWATHPDCQYHAQAAQQPLNHRNPWVCGNYWDGCNHVGGPLYSDEMHALAWLLRTAQGWGWETTVDSFDGHVMLPSVDRTPK